MSKHEKSGRHEQTGGDNEVVVWPTKDQDKEENQPKPSKWFTKAE